MYNGIFVFASSLLGPLYAIYVSGVDSNVIAVSVSWSTYLFSTVIFTYLISLVGDRVKEKEYLLIAGYILRAVVWFSYIFVAGLPLLIFLQVLLGLGEALGSPAFNAIFAEHLDKGKHIADYAHWTVISNLCGATAVAVGGVLVKFIGFEFLFSVMTLLALIPIIGLLMKPRQLL